jgi:hypothetical protein
MITAFENEEQSCANVLSYAACGCLIDYFEAVLAVSKELHRRDGSRFRRQYARPLAELATAIADRRIGALAFAASDDPTFLALLSRPPMDPTSSFLRGNYPAAKVAIEDRLSANPDCIDSIELLARTDAIAGTTTQVQRLYAHISRSLSSIVAKEESTRDQLDMLQKLAVNFYPLAWAEGVWAISSAESSPLRGPESLPLTNSIRSLPTSLHPAHAAAFPPATAEAFLRTSMTAYPHELPADYTGYALGIAEETCPVTTQQQRLAEADRALSFGDFGRAVEAVGRPAIGDRYYGPKFAKVRAGALLAGGDLEGCLNCIVSTYLQNARTHYILPVRDLVRRICELPDGQRLRPHPSLAILYDIYSRYVGNDYDSQIRFCFEDFLMARGVSRPSALAPLIGGFDRDKMLYFLRYICVPHVMDVMPVYEDSADLGNERVAVCNLLSEIDPASKEDYLEEVRDILIRQNAQKGIRQVEQSKIFVDEEGIRRAAELRFKESYERYRAFGGYDPAEAAEVERALEKAGEGDRSAFWSLEVEQNEKNTILARLLLDLRDEYVAGADHGLDGYLSVRIRHGTFAAQLRTPLERQKLITQRDKTIGEYRSNPYWPPRLLIPDASLSEQVDRRLALFSRQFDDFVQSILASWIQVRTTEGAVGAFDFRLLPAHARLVGSYLSPETSFAGFVDVVFSLLRRLLTESVSALRGRFGSEAVAAVDQMLTSLEEDVFALAGHRETAQFSLAIVNARADLHGALSRVADWFRPPTATSYPPFTLRDAVQIAIELIKRIYGRTDFAPRIETDSTLQLRGLVLPAFVDMFMILFENALKHAGLAEAPSVRIELKDKDEIIVIHVANTVAPSSVTPGSRARLDAIRSAMRHGDYKKAVRTEGGTGLHKVQKIIRHDFGTNGAMRFDYLGSESFVVELELEVRRLIVDAHSAD